MIAGGTKLYSDDDDGDGDGDYDDDRDDDDDYDDGGVGDDNTCYHHHS